MKIDFRSQLIHQTDYRAMAPPMNDTGCFVASIRAGLETFFERAMNWDQWESMWERAKREGAIRPSGFVNDHEHTGNIALDILGQWSEGWRFHYVKIEGVDGRESEILKPSMLGSENVCCPVWHTSVGVHMNVANALGTQVVWDPYPGLALRRIQSLRWYAIAR